MIDLCLYVLPAKIKKVVESIKRLKVNAVNNYNKNILMKVGNEYSNDFDAVISLGNTFGRDLLFRGVDKR